VAFVDPLAGIDDGALLGDAGADAVDVEVNVDTVGDGLLVAILHHQVLIEEAQRLLGGVAVRPTRKASKYSRTCRHTL
jgi:hypothetical protein